jgi:hypothetical protein
MRHLLSTRSSKERLVRHPRPLARPAGHERDHEIQCQERQRQPDEQPPAGIMGGLGGAGLPRPSGAGSTRQPDGVCRGGGGGGGGGGLFGGESGARPLTVAPWVLPQLPDRGPEVGLDAVRLLEAVLEQQLGERQVLRGDRRWRSGPRARRPGCRCRSRANGLGDRQPPHRARWPTIRPLASVPDATERTVNAAAAPEPPRRVAHRPHHPQGRRDRTVTLHVVLPSD